MDVAVRHMLIKAGHEAWTAANARMGEANDDSLTVYAQEHDAVLVTHDREFSTRRRRAVVGRHILLRCNEWDAADVLERNLPEILPVLGRKCDVFVQVSPDAAFQLSFAWD